MLQRNNRRAFLVRSPLTNGEYTWSNFRENPTCSRLDRFLFSPGWRRIFPYYQQEVQLRGVSDHFPLVITTDRATWGPGPFRLDNDWLDNLEFKDLVRSTWSEAVSASWSGHRIMGKFHKLKNKIKAWSVGERERRYGQKLKIEKEITLLDRAEGGVDWTEELRHERAFLKGQLDGILANEERAARFK